MAFKMRRSGMQLRSTTSTKPITTRFSSPLHQEFDISTEGDTLNISQTTGENIDGEVVPQDIGGGGGDPTPEQEKANLEHYERQEREGVCYQFVEGSGSIHAGKCEAQGLVINPNAKNRSECCMTPPKTNETTNTGEAELKIPGGSTPRTNILSPRELRMNMRMRQSASNRTRRLKAAANRNIRKALRKGQKPDQNDLRILSGEDLGDFRGINLFQDSSGTTSIFSKQKREAFQQNPGGQTIDPKSYVKELEIEAKRLRDAGFEGTSQELANMARSNVNANIESSGFEFDSGVEAGQYLDDRTKKVMDKFGYDTSQFGENAMNRRAKKQTNRLNRRLKRNKNMSEERKARIKRRIERRGGTPVKMSIELTRPSYKQKGFGK